MEIKHSLWAAAIVVALSLAWDDWRVRGELDQVRQQQAALTARLASAQLSPPDCPASPRGTGATPATAVAAPTAAPAVAPTQAKCDCNGVLGPDTVRIPPGTDLLGAIKIIQLEQAKNEPGSAAMNPFGSTK